MRILVAVKRVIGPYVKIRVKPDNTGVEKQVKMAMNPFDEIAIEEALRMREKGQANEVVVVSIGNDSTQETLRHALALGVDRAILIRTEETFESFNIAKILQKLVLLEKPDLVLMGKQSIDGDNNQTPQMLAGLLQWPQATNASEIQLQASTLEVVREIDGGLETLQVQLPAVVSTDLRLNTPRFANLANIMKAKTKELQVISLESWDLPLHQHVEILKVQAPKIRQGGIVVDSAEALMDKLQHEAKVI